MSRTVFLRYILMLILKSMFLHLKCLNIWFMIIKEYEIIKYWLKDNFKWPKEIYNNKKILCFLIIFLNTLSNFSFCFANWRTNWKKQTRSLQTNFFLSLSCYKAKYSMHSIWTASHKLPFQTARGSLHGACRSEGTREGSIKNRRKKTRKFQSKILQVLMEIFIGVLEA